MDSSWELETPPAEETELLSPATGHALPEENLSRRVKPPLLFWCGIAALTAVGCLGIYREIVILWSFWTGDPLRSIGILIPPASIVLFLRVWRQTDWETRGTWWGLLVIGLSYLLSILKAYSMLYAVFGVGTVYLIPVSLPVYVYGSGIVLLFAGTRVWRKAWFPLALLLLCQPVPLLSNGLIDIPLQSISARVARSFATMIGFAPTTPQLRLMFSPDFGMFIAPGCDGIRGAVTMGYVALILGYLKRVSFLRWAAYVSGAVLLGYLFNFTRLCVLVLYYRAALGHPALESLAKQADYAIGSCLFLVATFLFLWILRRGGEGSASATTAPLPAEFPPDNRKLWLKCAAFAAVVLLVVCLPTFALTDVRNGSATPASLAARMPKQIGEFVLTRTWYEQQNGTPLVESGSYSAPGSDETTLGVWVAPLFKIHDITTCWLARGLHPEILVNRQYVTAHRNSIPLKTEFYSDGITDTVVLNAFCTPASCSQFQPLASRGQIGILLLKPQISEIAERGTHPVSIMIRIDKLHQNVPKAATYDLLSTEAQRFLSGLDLNSLSSAFQ
ncbi:MAG: exosortase J [Terracidiphilus sp.]